MTTGTIHVRPFTDSDLAELTARSTRFPMDRVQGISKEDARAWLTAQIDSVTGRAFAITALSGSGRVQGVGTLQQLEWDSDMLGVSTAKLDVHLADPQDEKTADLLIDSLLQAACVAGNTFVWCKSPDYAHAALTCFERSGFVLRDREILLTRLPAKPGEMSDVVFRSPTYRIERDRHVALPELGALGAVFSDDRFHADPNISDETARRLWTQSVANACTDRADELFIAYDDELAVGVITVFDTQIRTIRACKLVRNLFHVAVAPSHQGFGLGRALITALLTGTVAPCDSIMVTTQSVNTSALNLYESCGFDAVSETLSLHAWL